MLLNDQKVYVGPFKSRKERMDEYEAKARHFTNVYVKNIDETLDEAGFEAMFTPFGPVTSRALKMQDTAEGEPKLNKGFGFVAFEKAEDAAKCVEALNGKEGANGKPMFCGRAQKRAERTNLLRREYEKRKMEMQAKFKGVNLYVKNLDESITDDALRQAFAEYGTITSAKVMINDKGANAGFGFVCFSTEEEATRAVTEMNLKILVSKPLYVALAQRKDQRQRQLALQRNQRGAQMRMQPGQQMPPNMFPPQQGIMYLPQAMGQMPRGGYAQFGGQVPRPRFMQQGVPMQYRQMTQQQMQMQQVAQQQQQQQQAAAQGQVQAGRGRGAQRSGQPKQGRGAGTGAPQQQPQQQQPNAQFRQQVRNMPGQQMPQGQMPPQQQLAPPQPALVQAGQEPLTASALASAPEPVQKQMLGERLYPLIANISRPELAGKITGMLLEMDNSELLHLLEDPSALHAKVIEAVKVLEDFTMQQQQSQ